MTEDDEPYGYVPEVRYDDMFKIDAEACLVMKDIIVVSRDWLPKLRLTRNRWTCYRYLEAAEAEMPIFPDGFGVCCRRNLVETQEEVHS